MLFEELMRLEDAGKPIHLAVTGRGWMGSGFIAQLAHVPGMEAVIYADKDVELARSAFLKTGFPNERLVVTHNPNQAMDAVRAGKRVITGSLAPLAHIEVIDIIVDATPSPEIGAETAFAAIQANKDLVLINIEVDVTLGHILHKMAQEKGVLYSVSSGDEPGCLMELYDFVKSLGFEPIVIGKGKNNPLNPAATPDSVRDSAKRADKSAYQVASYVDGTKTMFEMTCAANATGCPPMVRGMHGPEATLETVSEVFALTEDGGITNSYPAVDFVQGGSMAGGVFVTVRVKDARIREDLTYLKVGQGEYFTFFRPYHLWFLEAPISIARAYLHRQTTLVPLPNPVADVMAVAKRDLNPGELLDSIGGYTFHGLMDRAEIVRDLYALPVGIAEGAKIQNKIPKGALITWNDVELDESKLVVALRRKQDEMFAVT